MKYEIEAAVNFLTSLFFPTSSSSTSSSTSLSHSLSFPHSQSTSSLPSLSSLPFPSSHSSSPSKLNLISADETTTNKNFSFEKENEKFAKLFSKQLNKTLAKKYCNHWYEEEPIKGQAFRSILVDLENNFIDKIILETAKKIHWKNVIDVLKSRCKNGFQLWIDPGEVEVHFLFSSPSLPSSSSLSPSSSSSSHSISQSNLPSSLSSPYKSSPRLPNQIIYSIRRKPSAYNFQSQTTINQSKNALPMANQPMGNQINNPPMIIGRAPSPPSPSPPSSSPPSSSSPSLPSSSPPSSPAHSSSSSSSVKMPIFTRQNKPIRISVRQTDEILENSFDQPINSFDDNNLNNDLSNLNNLNNDTKNSSVKNSFSILQPAM